MTQRIFDIENEKDYADLWDILPDEVEKARKVKTGIEFLDKDNEPCLYISYGYGEVSIIKINWHDKTEITRPVNYESMVGCVGWFADYEDGKIFLGVLSKADGVFRDSLGRCYKSFTPAKKSELKFYGED